MADIEELSISFPDFVLDTIIDPEQFDQNNAEIVGKINETIDKINSDEILINTANTKADNAVTISNTANTKADNAVTTANSANTKSDNAVTTANSAVTTANGAVTTANNAVTIANDATVITTNAVNSAQEAQQAAETAAVAAQSTVGNTTILYEVYTIVNPNVGDGTFTYKDSADVQYTGTIGESGEQIFTLIKGDYPLNQNRVEVSINDTLQRSVASGGLIEVDSTHVALTSPEASGAEITIKYYQKIGLAGEHKLSHAVGEYDEVAGLTCVNSAKPSSATAIWFKVVE